MYQPVVIYRKCTQRNIFLLYGKRRLIKKLSKGEAAAPNLNSPLVAEYPSLVPIQEHRMLQHFLKAWKYWVNFLSQFRRWDDERGCKTPSRNTAANTSCCQTDSFRKWKHFFIWQLDDSFTVSIDRNVNFFGGRLASL